MSADTRAELGAIDCAACAPPGATAQQPSRVCAKLPWLGLLLTIFYFMVPKCPICLAAYLSVCGVSVGAAGIALSALGPVAGVSTLFAIGMVVWRTQLAQRALQRAKLSKLVSASSARP